MIYELSITEDYVSRWGYKEAVRELLQNALDSHAPFDYEFIETASNTFSLTLRSADTMLPPKMLLLGATSKAKDDSTIGCFGEGFKLAMLVLVRLGYKLEILNGDVTWAPELRHNRLYNCKTLIVREKKIKSGGSDLVVTVSNLSVADKEATIASCLKMQDTIGDFYVTLKGQILLDQPGKLYVGSLFVCDTGLKFGYNTDPLYLKLDRDRQTVGDWDLRTLTKTMWVETKRYDTIAKLLKDNLDDLVYLRYDNIPQLSDACYKLAMSETPDAELVCYNSDLQEALENGRHVKLVPEAFHAVATKAAGYIASKRQQVVSKTPHEVVSEWLEGHEYDMSFSMVESFTKELVEPSKRWYK